ncbi:sensor histidine kinase [Streptomyces sp. A7024]|uniref:histidine kinase n=2 Tax=Streptomyces coryli TaxID=1128680 RepID=A0A6G4U483_9ACTN|nr:sensor histidine kinase [Streptomyces coryli]
MSPRNWRVRTRLNAILLIPVIVALVFAGLRVNESIETWRSAQDAEQVARLVQVAGDYSNAIMNERDITTAPLLAGKQNSPLVQKARAQTNEAAEAFAEQKKDVPDTDALKRRLEHIDSATAKLDGIRAKAFSKGMKGVDTQEAYALVYRPLMALSNDLGLGTDNVTSFGRTIYAIALTSSAASLDRSIGMQLLNTKDSAQLPVVREAFSSYARLEVIASEEYEFGGRPKDLARLNEALQAAQATGKKQLQQKAVEAKEKGQRFVPPPGVSDTTRAMFAPGSNPSALARKGITPQTWWAMSTGKFQAYLEVEKELSQEAVNEANKVAKDAEQDTYINSAAAIAALLLAFIVAAMMARSMGRAMRRLRNAAFGVAEQRLPMLVDQLSRTDPGRVDTRVTPIPINSRDEIGEVARAFDQVHREAVRLASEQALLRGNINAIFTNLSRRNQGLIERQLELVSGLEESEADPDQLEHLFQMDHLATRMRRNGENLLVLAGEDTGRHWDQPVPLLDVLRAATSEVESYERVELSGVPDCEIHGTAVSDLVHLLAELLENATTFSSPHTKVRVTATRLPDRRVMIEIHDKGIGLTAEDFADINHRLANPPVVDAAISQRMGLFVVGRLADRHGIRVQLRPSGEQSGTTSLVMLPEAITHGGGGDPMGAQPEEEFTVSRIVGDNPTLTNAFDPKMAVGQRTAAELGFNDGAYAGAQSDASHPGAAFGGANGAAPYPVDDPIGRSLQREERRAALEARAAQQEAAARETYQEREQYGQEREQREQYGPPAGASYPEPQQAPQQAPQQDAYQQQQGAQYGSYEASDSSGAPDASEDARAGNGLQSVGFPRAGEPSAGAPAPITDSEWRSDNDERWERAARAREPEAGGITSAGLPKRVPRANLVDGTATQTPQGGPQVSRAPEDVRGRLANLRRGVQQGRGQGTTENDRPGSDNWGPGSSYDQER